MPTFGSRQYHVANERACPSFEEQVSTIGELIKEGKIKHWCAWWGEEQWQGGAARGEPRVTAL